MTNDEQRDLLKRALIEHLRGWVGGDALWSAACRDQSEIDPATLRRIATGYYVSRGMHEGKEGRIAGLIKDALPKFRGSLSERAKVVEDLAIEAYETVDEGGKRLTNGRQFSGFSKFMWFLRPKGWALFDKYAQQGLARPQKSLSFMSYYKRLEELSFEEVADDMRSIISVSDLPGLWPERVIDKYLMICGQGDGDDFVGIAQSDYIRILDQYTEKAMSSKVERLTDSLLAAVQDRELLKVHEKANPRTKVSPESIKGNR